MRELKKEAKGLKKLRRQLSAELMNNSGLIDKEE
jgi:hypothetical protein